MIDTLPDRIHLTPGDTHFMRRSFEANRKKKKRKLDYSQFVAWDGEGVTDPDGAHRYVLLANSRGAYADGPSLTLKTCLLLLLDEADKYPRARHVIFAGTYDVTMMLRELGPERLALLFDADEKGIYVTLDGRTFRIGYRSRKCLYVAEMSGKTVRRSMRLWDVWGFFQSTFVGACKKWFGEDLLAEVPMFSEIEEMKRARADFATEDSGRVLRYCVAECEALEKLCVRLGRALEGAGLHPQRFDGPGAIAGALFRREGVREHFDAGPDAVDAAARVAYAGGRIEVTAIGCIGPAYGYDIRSAYPAAIAELPSLTDGRWRHVPPAYREVLGPADFGLARVRFRFPSGLPWYPLFFRNYDGTILFPQEGEGWYHLPEVYAAAQYQLALGGKIHILDRWDYESSARPFAFVRDIYEQRRTLKAANHASEKVLKLALNSLYGKMASQLGGKREKWPPYFSQLYAGAITAKTRSRLVLAGLEAPRHVVMFATDGIYTTRPILRGATTGEGDLGSWEDAGFTPSLIVAQAGVYWVRGARGFEVKFRGFDRSAIADPDVVLGAWQRGQWEVRVPVTRFVTARAALHRTSFTNTAGTWERQERVLDITGDSSKRTSAPPGSQPHRRAVNLGVTHNYDYHLLGAASAPYPREWESGATPPNARPVAFGDEEDD